MSKIPTAGPVIARTAAGSTPHHPPRPRPAGRPNVLVVLLDDIGFGQLGTFGGEIDTPSIDRIAGQGLRYNRFHVTAMCSPSRASLLTGRNAHAVGIGFLADMPGGYPGYSGRIPASAATLPRILRDAGWNTMAVGKWHLTPRNDRTAAGPFGTWPLGQGFERFYGFLHGDANQWTPTLYRDNSPVEPPATPEQAYHLSEDLVDEAIRLVKDQQHAAPDKPFLMYLAPGAGHAPHQAPAEWIDRYAGRFDDGWEVLRERTFARQLATGVVPTGTTLTPRPAWVQDWAALGPEERRLFARYAEAHAGFVAHFDHHLGRLLDALEELGVLDETMIVLTSDNGASAEGGRIGSLNEHRFGFGVGDDLADNLAAIDDIGGWRGYNHYPWGWAWAGNTPFHLWKRYSWLGGVRVPMVLKPPRGVVAPVGTREQWCHVVDIAPTVLDLCGVPVPDQVDGVVQQPLAGASLAATMADPAAPAPRTTQYFEMLGSRSIIHDGWKATTDHVSSGVDDERMLPGSRDFATDRWCLFRLDDDFSEAHDLADQYPDVVADLTARWEAEAEANQVFPLTDGLYGHLPGIEPPLWPVPDRLVVRPGAHPVADEAVPSLALGALVEADVVVPDGGGEGVLAAIGDWSNGWALVVVDGRPRFLLNATSTPYDVTSAVPLTPGPHTVGFRLAGADGVLLVDGAEVARAPFPEGMGASGIQIGGGGLRLGHDAGFPVSDDYSPPFPWTGVLRSVTFTGGQALADLDAERARLTALLRSE
ncbi:arylsulfatase [Nocardioides sp. L-11A]|uniref:arylsulfatase n=1 Tax=Nocardioides sp. L-11A TaxID=3043848 RepID=UPI00249C5C18|nr:arylsulfatase [Nocardioides sp. L-11A]